MKQDKIPGISPRCRYRAALQAGLLMLVAWLIGLTPAWGESGPRFNPAAESRSGPAASEERGSTPALAAERPSDSSATPSRSDPPAGFPRAALPILREFVKFRAALQPADLSAGSCVKNATDFYSRLLEAKLDTSAVRIVLLVREPNRGMPNPIVPDPAWVRGEPVKFWIWHAFVIAHGWVFDPNYRKATAPLETYFQTLWGKDPARDQFWVFAVQLQDFPQIAGSDYPGGPPRMLRFVPITWRQLVANPLHRTQRR